MKNWQLESIELQLTLASILDDQIEYNKLIEKKRQFKLNYLLKENNIEKEIDYFEDEE